jgi:hypothetical protein
MNANYFFLAVSEEKIVELERRGSRKEMEKDFYPSTKSTMFPLPSRRAKQAANQLKF